MINSMKSFKVVVRNESTVVTDYTVTVKAENEEQAKAIAFEEWESRRPQTESERFHVFEPIRRYWARIKQCTEIK